MTFKVWVHDTQALSPSRHGLTVCAKGHKGAVSADSQAAGRAETDPLLAWSQTRAPALHPPALCPALSRLPAPSRKPQPHRQSLGPIPPLGSSGTVTPKQLPTPPILSSDFQAHSQATGRSVRVCEQVVCTPVSLHKGRNCKSGKNF